MNVFALQMEIQYWIQQFDIKIYRIIPIMVSETIRGYLVQIGSDIGSRRGMLITQTMSWFDIRSCLCDYYIGYDILTEEVF